MNCLEFKQNLPDLLDEETPESALHLHSCPGCATEWEEIGQLRSLFKRLPDREPHPVSIRKILEVATASPKSRGKLDGLVSWLVRAGLTRTFAPAMVVVFLFVSLLMAVSKTEEIKVAAKDSSNGALSGGVVPQSILRERLWENPFEGKGSAGSLGGPYQIIKTAAGDRLPLLAPQELAPSELEKVYEQRRRVLLETDADNLLMRARRLKTMGRVDLALKDFETIYLFYPDYTYMSDVLMYRAQCYAALGNSKKAVESLEVVAKRYPDRKDIVGPLIEQLSKQHP